MTSGTISRNSPDGLSIFQKTWSGTNGKSVENPYSCDLRQVSRKKCEYWSVVWYSGKELSRTRLPSADYCYYDSTLPVLPVSGNQDLQALAKLATAIRGHDFNMAVFGAEGRQTIELIRDSCSRLIGGFNALRKGDVRTLVNQFKKPGSQKSVDSAKKHLQLGDFSAALLELRYGWQPLLQDLYELMKALKGRTGTRQVTFRARQTVSQFAEVSVTPQYYPMPGQQTTSLSYKVVFTESLSKPRELGLLDPASVAWEKLPWSFVIDWFIPIGTYLGDLSFFGAFKNSAVRTVFQECECAIANRSVWKNAHYPGDDWLANMSFVGKRIVVNRTVGPINVPAPNFKTLEKAFSKTHLENAAALIHQLISHSHAGSRLPTVLR